MTKKAETTEDLTDGNEDLFMSVKMRMSNGMEANIFTHAKTIKKARRKVKKHFEDLRSAAIAAGQDEKNLPEAPEVISVLWVEGAYVD